MMIQKIDFSDALVDFSQNTPVERVNPHINDALSFDLLPALPYKLVQVLLAEPTVLIAEWKTGVSYAAGVHVYTQDLEAGMFRKKVWKALSTNASQPATGAAAWQYSDLLSFWEGFVKPYWVVSAYLRFIGVGNVFSTPSGLRSFNEAYSNNIDPATFGAFRRAFQTKADDYKARLLSELNRRKGSVNGVTYSSPAPDCNPAPSSPIGFNVI